jgi:hypothetical protein
MMYSKATSQGFDSLRTCYHARCELRKNTSASHKKANIDGAVLLTGTTHEHGLVAFPFVLQIILRCELLPFWNPKGSDKTPIPLTAFEFVF